MTLVFVARPLVQPRELLVQTRPCLRKGRGLRIGTPVAALEKRREQFSAAGVLFGPGRRRVTDQPQPEIVERLSRRACRVAKTAGARGVDRLDFSPLRDRFAAET